MRIRALLVALSLVGGLFLMASPSSAKTDFCEEVGSLGSNSPGSDATADEAAALRDDFEALADTDVPPKVKKALLRIASFYDALAKAKTKAAQVAATTKHYKKYAKGFKVFTKYYTQECLVIPGTPK